MSAQKAARLREQLLVRLPSVRRIPPGSAAIYPCLPLEISARAGMPPEQEGAIRPPTLISRRWPGAGRVCGIRSTHNNFWAPGSA